MFRELRFAWYAIKKNFQSSAELRTSFLMNVVGMVLNNTSFIILWVFFVQVVGTIGGWTAADIIGLQGFTSLAYGLVSSMGYGLRKLPQSIASGVFDRFMLSPKSLLLRTATSAFSASGIGDVIFAVICFIAYGVMIHVTALQVAFIVILAILSTIIFAATAVAIYSLSFFFMDAMTATNSVFELFMTPTLFHGGAFQGALRFIYTFIIPSLLIGAIPVEAVREVSMATLSLMTVLAVLWSLLAYYIFNRAVRSYESSNLMTFGG